MPKTYNRWIHTKSCNFAPEGTLQLGQILAQPKDPAYVLQPTGPLPLHKNIIVENTSRENLNMQTNNELSAQFSAWAKLGYVPARFKTDASTKRSHDFVWHFDKLESKTMSPTIAYVKDAMRHGDVPVTLQSWLFKRRVYMVTGVRVASGVRMRRKVQASMSVGTSGETSAPDQLVTAGTEAKLSQSSLDSEDFDKATDFVFAYRLNEVRYRGKVTHKPYTGGETSSAEAPPVERESEIVIDDFEVLKISDIPVAGNPREFDRITVPGHEDIECFVGKEG